MPVNLPLFFLQIAKTLPGLSGKISDDLVIYQIAMVHLSARDLTTWILKVRTL